RPRRAAVSSFGIGGTNAHLILEQTPEAPVVAQAEETTGVVPWVLSGKSEDALRDQAARLLDLVAAQPDLRPAQVGLALATTRT
ncbi:ketoacyl-synthetase C-terminal extension domain-containing protein, partial [Streptomyces monomycini]